VKYTNSLDIDELNGNNGAIKVLLNPVKDFLQLEYTVNTMTSAYKIFNASGKCVQRGKLERGAKHRIKLETRQSGMYFLSIDDIYSAKFIVR
jgi:hypothetical protein